MKKESRNQPVVIKNPTKKLKTIIKKMEKYKQSRRQELLKSKNFTFSI